MLDDRKAAILTTVVNEYISTAQPVGSSHVVKAEGVNVSSATVRNEMALLEQDGYLVQPHTSAGRIPTDKGYRYFVDCLAGPGTLAQPQRQQVRDFFAHAHGELEQMLAETSHLLSQLTDYAAVVVRPADEVALIRSVQLVDLGHHAVLLVIVLSNGRVEKKTLDLDASEGRSGPPARSASERESWPSSQHDLSQAGAVLAAHLMGKTLFAATVPPPTGHEGVDAILARTTSALANLGHDGEPDHIFVGGASRMASAFDAVATVRSVLGILEQQYVVVSLLKDVLDRGLSVSIGAENGIAPLAECAVVVSPYQIEGEQVGTIGVLGPTRMNYPQALAAVAAVGQRLGRHLSGPE